ncbi:hypothetical protein C8C99_0430 [Acidovorax sp. 107]|uniref:hypothetical protein n=1 Tax=Acidovorax sp. 107 TaxID=2135638 RepID=UPI000D397A48|nr:hypothetical protein [Acidovorax sp. 107]PUA95629.1 hypothetical protein C8C99_0430 [Acidovorax sp. 107]
MGYRDSDDSNFSRHGMGRDADDMRFNERGDHQGYGSDDHRSGGPGGYRQELEGRNDHRSDRYDHERYGQYGLTRGGGGAYRSESQGYPSRASRDAGGWYGSQSRSGYDQDLDRPQRAWAAPYESQAFRDAEGRFASPYSEGDRGQGSDGNAYGFTRNAPPALQNRGHRDPDYQQWRDEQLRMLDDDYDSWRKERYQKFSDDFSQWRSSRTPGTSGQSSQGQHNQKGSGANNASGGTSSGSQGNTAKSKDAT